MSCGPRSSNTSSLVRVELWTQPRLTPALQTRIVYCCMYAGGCPRVCPRNGFSCGEKVYAVIRRYQIGSLFHSSLIGRHAVVSRSVSSQLCWVFTALTCCVCFSVVVASSISSLVPCKFGSTRQPPKFKGINLGMPLCKNWHLFRIGSLPRPWSSRTAAARVSVIRGCLQAASALRSALSQTKPQQAAGHCMRNHLLAPSFHQREHVPRRPLFGMRVFAFIQTPFCRWGYGIAVPPTLSAKFARSSLAVYRPTKPHEQLNCSKALNPGLLNAPLYLRCRGTSSG